MFEKLQTFLINISIIEGRHFIWPNTNSAVLVKIDNLKKCTAVKFNTDSPYYNEYFVFEFSTTLEKIIDKTVTITVIKPGSILRKRKILGSTTFDVGTVWYQKDHQLYHKWALLTAPSNEVISGTRGYLKLDVSVLSKGELPEVPKFVNTDDIETNLFLPDGASTKRQRINFIFDVYRAADLVKKNPIYEGARKVEVPPTTHIGVSFSGFNVKTTTRKISAPVWNERLVVPELFPPLCQRFKLELYHDGNKRATRYLNLRSVSSDKEEGFLPTFGPSFVHFYSPNNLEGYLGKVLLSLETVLLGDLAEYETKGLVITEVQPIREDYFLKFENIVVFATIFEVSSIKKKFNDKPISFRLSCGPIQTDESGDKANPSVSSPLWPKPINKSYSFLSIEAKKPCLHLTLTLPDIRKRMFNHNLLTKMLRELKMRLDEIEEIFQNKDYKIASVQTESLLLETLDFIASVGGKYIDIASNYNLETDPILDQERMKMSLKEMKSIVSLSKKIPSNQSKKKIFQKIEKFYARIETLIDIIEDWPQIYLWMIHGNRRVAYHIMQPRNVIYSPIDEEKGVDCGAVRSIYFQSEARHNVADFIGSTCKMDVMVWMGLPRHLTSCLPSGFAFSSEPIPKFLIAEERHCFQVKAHIFQGRFTPGADKSGLCDPFIEIIIGFQFRQSQVLRKILTPVWDQTLVFQEVVLYGSRDFIVANPPTVCFEIYDKDECFKFEPVGKCVVTPVVKMLTEPYGPPKFPPRLSWEKVYNQFDVSAEILTVVEFLELAEGSAESPPADGVVVKIPPDIKPYMVNHRIEVVFWGVRDLRKVQMSQITKPKIVIECGNVTLTSDTLVNAKKSLNFTNPVKIFEASFPEQQKYAPPLCLKMYDCRNFGISVFAGTQVVPIWSFLYKPFTAEELEEKFQEVREDSLDYTPSIESIIQSLDEDESKIKAQAPKEKKWRRFLKKFSCKKTKIVVKPSTSTIFEEETAVEDSDDFDWWTKFYASLEDAPSGGNIPLSLKYKLKIYSNELEKQPEFGGFTDTLTSFPMYKGKRTGDEAVDEENTTGVFKGALRIYQWPLPEGYITTSGLPLKGGIFQDFPSNDPVRFVLRIYCIRGLNLRPRDLDGKSDPYISVTLNQQRISDKENRILGQNNPIFGRCFELNGVFPQDHTVMVSVIDHDVATADDLIGETKINLENRFYTKHRASCGLATDYLTSGYCEWRDQQKPTTILDNFCKRFNIADLRYEPTFVKVASREFAPKNFKATDNGDLDRQTLALAALKRWAEIPVVGCDLVPEHVETRSLYNPQKPGIEQLWLDILPCVSLPTPKQVHTAPRQPVAYELRVIVWNAEDIKLTEECVLTGEKKSDIFVKGWVTTSESAQYTDVHYRSVSGQANFNWRFIFSFEYLSSENKIVIKKKSLFGSNNEEEKLQCKVTLQAWDNDTFSYDDFLGILILELSRLPRGARSAKTCSLAQLLPNATFFNLFKIRRSRGWWPLRNFDSKNQVDICVGAVELEFELLLKEDAEKCPAGFGRDDPQGLAKPERPETSFSWFRNPLKAMKFSMKFYRKKVLKILIFVFVIVVIFVVCYMVSKFGIKKLVGS